jgi:hypothetical protein
MQQRESSHEFGCDQCWPESASSAWIALASLSTKSMLIDDSHFIVSLRSCLECRQNFVVVMAETIDWLDGDDPQFRTIVPLTEHETNSLSEIGADVVSLLSKVALQRRALQNDAPKGRTQMIYWRVGIPFPPRQVGSE